MRYLEKSDSDFHDDNMDVILAFEFPHILREKYLPVCEKVILYDFSSEETQAEMLSMSYNFV